MGTNQAANSQHYAEVKTSDLAQADSKALREKVLRGLLTITCESNIIAIQVIPERWPQKVIIQTRDKENKDLIINQGITVDQKHIEIREKGQKYVRVNIFDAPLDMPDDIIIKH